MLWEGTLATIYITFLSSLLAYVAGLPLGVLLVVTSKVGVHPIVWLNKLLGFIVNILRSVPFLILLIAVLPLTRAIIGTTIGTKATVVPLFIASFPFVARLVEASLIEVNEGVIEAAWSMGSTPFQIIYKVLIPEALPSLINGAAIAVTTILSYSAMSGIVGGGGLGDIAIRYGYHRYETDIMFLTVIELVVIVQIIQAIGERWAKGSDKRLKLVAGRGLFGLGRAPWAGE
ncbi:MAG: ABC transporter permease [Clostridiales Family XIII bacterium]|jgi:D-methionine transport system permease protein|nr:ABC transporter permease [Clostridiales Family XIII bacterium]